MNIVVIKFEQGFRLVRNGRRIEAWERGEKLDDFNTWDEALKFLDALKGYRMRPEAQPIGTGVE